MTETAVGLSLAGVRPNVAGNGDSAYVLLYGSGFVTGMTVRLVRAGETDIEGSPVTVESGGAMAATSLSIRGRAVGPWDIVIVNPDGDSRVLPGAFRIEAGGAPQLWSDVVGPTVVRAGRPARFALFVGNRGNVDARAVPLRIAVQGGVGVGLGFSITPPPFQDTQVRTVWSQTPLDAPADDGTTNILLLLPLLPAGFTTTLELTVTASAVAEGQDFKLRGLLDAPWLAPDLDPQIAADLVAGARAYAAAAMGVTIPVDLDPFLDSYLRTHIAHLAEHGRGELVVSLGAQTQIYSRAWLIADVARFGAVLAGAQPPGPLARNTGVRTWPDSPPPIAGIIEPGIWEKILSTAVSLIGPASAQGQVLPEGATMTVGCTHGGGQLVGCITDSGTVLGVTCCPKGATQADCCRPGGGPFTNVRGSRDPNEKTGAAGAGAARFLAANEGLRYSIAFENVETASAAAQEVVITDQLDDTTVDLDTFSLGPIAFGGHHITPPPGLSQYSARVDLRPAIDLLVAIDARLDKTTGLVTWRFLSLDPLTGQFTEDPIAGFLPPNVGPPEGDGSVLFTVAPRVVDTPICNHASIVFDVNDAILTPEWCNTVDQTPPSSRVSALAPVQTSASFNIQWSGTDSGSGVAAYTILVAEDGGPFAPFVSDTTDTAAVFSGRAGSAYAFFSVARDAVGNVEAPPSTADTQTLLGAPATATAAPPATSTPPNAPTGTPIAAATHTLRHTATHSPAASPSSTPRQTRTSSATRTRTTASTRTPAQPATATPSPTPAPGPAVCGDVDGDDRVTLRDALVESLALLLGRREPRFDINHDGRVTLDDLAHVVSQIGRHCTRDTRTEAVRVPLGPVESSRLARRTSPMD